MKTYPYICITQLNTYTMKKLTVSQETFAEMLLGLVKSGVTFEAEETEGGFIVVEFTGGY